MSVQADNDLLKIHINVDIKASTLQTIVAHAKNTAPRIANGTVRVDTAEYVSVMISSFLKAKNFDAYVQDEANYPSAIP